MEKNLKELFKNLKELFTDYTKRAFYLTYSFIMALALLFSYIGIIDIQENYEFCFIKINYIKIILIIVFFVALSIYIIITFYENKIKKEKELDEKLNRLMNDTKTNNFLEIKNTIYDYLKENRKVVLKNLAYQYISDNQNPVLEYILKDIVVNKTDKKFLKKFFEKIWERDKENKYKQKICDFYRRINDMHNFIFLSFKKELIKWLEKQIKKLNEGTTSFEEEGKIVSALSFWYKYIPKKSMKSFIEGMTKSYIGTIGCSRIDAYSDSAAPYIENLFKNFNIHNIKIFIELIKENYIIKLRISKEHDKESLKLNRLRNLANIILNNIKNINIRYKKFLEILVDKEKTKELYNLIKIEELHNVGDYYLG